jgi:hypothetical protein
MFIDKVYKILEPEINDFIKKQKISQRHTGSSLRTSVLATDFWNFILILGKVRSAGILHYLCINKIEKVIKDLSLDLSFMKMDHSIGSLVGSFSGDADIRDQVILGKILNYPCPGFDDIKDYDIGVSYKLYIDNPKYRYFKSEYCHNLYSCACPYPLSEEKLDSIYKTCSIYDKFFKDLDVGSVDISIEIIKKSYYSK